MTNLVTSEVLNMVVKDQEIWNFDVKEDGVYIISISAKCKNWIQNIKRLFNDDDLAVQLDGYLFAEVKGKKREFTSSGSWNGNEIKNDSKTVLFIVPLRNGKHKINFWVGGNPVMEEIKVYKIEENEIDLVKSNILDFNKFLDVIIKNISVHEIKVLATATVGSSLEMKIDGQVEINPKYKRYQKWYWYGQELRGGSKEYKQPNGFDKNEHSLSFDCQGKPKITSFLLKIDTENIEYESGHIKIYKDIIPGNYSGTVYLRSTHSDKGEILAEIKDGEMIGIHTRIVEGEYIAPLSKIWHEVIYNEIRGFILSSYVEIDGQEREKIIDLIKEKCNQYNADQSFMLSIAGVESHFKPYATSNTGPIGVFQLTDDTKKRFRLTDAFDFYQNIDGGIRNYKDIESRISGRGDVLIKRLAAWYDGPTGTIRNINKKLFNYEKLSDPTKSFIQSVQANIKKKDWYNIISIPVTALVLLLLVLFGGNFKSNENNSDLQTVNVITSTMNQSYEVDALNDPQHNSKYPDKGKNISRDSAMYYSDRTGTITDALNFPTVILDGSTDNVVFINSNKKVVERINLNFLNLEKFLNPTNIDLGDNFYNFSHISPVVLENPPGVFYFAATDSYGCGASNCWWVFYHFDSNKGTLRVIDSDNLFGGVIGLYLSPDQKYIALARGVSGGSCDNGDYISVYDLQDFSKQEIGTFTDVNAGNRNLENLHWKDNSRFQFDAIYQLECTQNIDMKTTWLYDAQAKNIEKVKSEIIDPGPGAG